MSVNSGHALLNAKVLLSLNEALSNLATESLVPMFESTRLLSTACADKNNSLNRTKLFYEGTRHIKTIAESEIRIAKVAAMTRDAALMRPEGSADRALRIIVCTS